MLRGRTAVSRRLLVSRVELYWLRSGSLQRACRRPNVLPKCMHGGTRMVKTLCIEHIGSRRALLRSNTRCPKCAGRTNAAEIQFALRATVGCSGTAELQSQLPLQFDPASLGQSDCAALVQPCDPLEFKEAREKECPEGSCNVIPAFSPFETSTRKTFSRGVAVDAELLEPPRSVLRNPVLLGPRRNPQFHALCCLVNFDTDATSEV